MFTTNEGPKMELPNDLKNYRAPLGAFQLISPDTAAFIIVVGAFGLFFFFGGH